MKFRQIEAFRCVMMRGTTAAAAAEMHVSQPAISRLINDLENEVGFALFERRKGRLHPTREASEFFAVVEESFIGLEKVKSVAEQIRSKEPRAIRIACSHSLGSALLPLAIKEHKKFYPQEKFTIHTDSVPQLVVKLQSDAVDLALGPALPSLIGVESEPIGSARHVFAAQKDHPLTQKNVITPDDLKGECVLEVLDTKPAYWSKIAETLAPVQEHLVSDIGIDSSHTGYAMIAAGMAVGVIEPFAARTWSKKDIITRKFEPGIYFNYAIAFPTGCRRYQSLHLFVDTIKRVAKTMPEFNAE